MDLTLSVKENRGGFFISLLVFSEAFNRGVTCLYLPVGVD